MKVAVDQELCIECGLCVDTCPEVFAWDDNGKSKTIVEEVPEDCEECAQESIDGCPTEAIKEV